MIPIPSRQPSRRSVRVAAVLAALLVAPTLAAAPHRLRTRVLVVGPDEADARIRLTREAVEFWNRTFVDLDLEPALLVAEVVAASPVTRALENYAWQISRRAGRPPAGSFEPDPPPELTDLGVDVVVLLSAQDLMPFAWPLRIAGILSGRYFIAIHSDPDLPSGSNVTRNVIAHELGHVLGLVHGAVPTSLMCLPCLPAASEGEEADFRPLTARDRSRLVELYSRDEC